MNVFSNLIVLVFRIRICDSYSESFVFMIFSSCYVSSLYVYPRLMEMLIRFQGFVILNIIPPPIIIFIRFGQDIFEIMVFLAALFFLGIQYVRAVLYLCSMLVFFIYFTCLLIIIDLCEH